MGRGVTNGGCKNRGGGHGTYECGVFFLIKKLNLFTLQLLSVSSSFAVFYRSAQAQTKQNESTPCSSTPPTLKWTVGVAGETGVGGRPPARCSNIGTLNLIACDVIHFIIFI